MQTRVKSTAIMMALVITLSVLTSLAATTTVAAHTTTTTTTITASNRYPAVGQSVTFTVKLKAGTTALSKPVHLWCTFNGVRYEKGTFKTVNGVYTFTGPFSKTGQVIYHTDFAGDSTYAASSDTVTVYVGTKTTTTITASNKYPAIGQAVTLTVTLKAGTTGLSKPVKIWHYLNGVRYEDGTHTTINGVYKFTEAFGSKGQCIYYAKFAGDSKYSSSQGTVTVNIRIPTTMTISGGSYDGMLRHITFMVSLKAGTTGLDHKLVKIWHTLPNGARVEDETVYTNDGLWVFISNEFSLPVIAGQYVYHADFAGDSTYAASSATRTVNVGKTTTTTITASNTNPTVGQSVTFTVTLKSGTTPLNKPVKIWHYMPDLTIHEDGTHYTVNGVYKFTQAFGSKGERIYHADFAGDSTYASSTDFERVNVKPIGTTTTVTATKTLLPTDEPLTITVTLKEGSIGLSKPVQVWYYKDGVIRTDIGTVNTVNGVWSITRSFSIPGEYEWHAYFAGDSKYAASTNYVDVNVW